MTKHDTETTSPTEPRETYGVPPLPESILAQIKRSASDIEIARFPFQNGFVNSLTMCTDINNDGIFIGNMWRPIPFDDTRNLPYEHPTRHEWDTPHYDVKHLDFDYELLPTGWLPQQYKRFRAWEFGMFIQIDLHLEWIRSSWSAFHGIYAPKLFFFGCNAGWVEPSPDLYPHFQMVAIGSANPVTAKEIGQKCRERFCRTTDTYYRSLNDQLLYRSITREESYEVKSIANPSVKNASTKHGFHWKFPSYVQLLANKPDGDPYYPRLDLCDEQYEWDRPVYDQPDLDFSTEPTLPGYTRLQFLRRRAWEKDCYLHRVAKLTGKRNKPAEPVVTQDVIDKLQTNN